MKTLVVGYGSIGNRHARILNGLGCDVSVVSGRQIDFPNSFKSLDESLSKNSPTYVIIANRTSEHFATLRALQKKGFRGMVMVEKPLFAEAERAEVLCFKKVWVAYNLRFHPLILKVRNLLRDQPIITAQAYVGKNLATWRPQTDYRKSYSAFKDQGGGVLRDLSHELDYMIWILGGWRGAAAIGGHYSKLDIETDDVFSVLLKTKRCENVFIHMNYVDPVGRREITFVTEMLSIKVDLFNGWIEVNGQREECPVDRDFTYRGEHEAVLSGRWENLCSYEEGFEVMRLIEAAEKASKNGKWVKR